jgi:DNA-binding response OmpR family regulator
VRILLVEDDPRMRTLVARGLSEQGYRVLTASNGPDAVNAALAAEFDAIVLDDMLPGFEGVEVIRRVRDAGCRSPVLMLTARDTPADVVRGLDAGADDYLAKPFAFAVLLARIRALARRTPPSGSTALRAADLTLQPATRVVTRSGGPLHLTRTEFQLLEILLRHAGRVVTREVLVDRIWGGRHEVERNTLDVFVRSLRQKVDAPGLPRLIYTIRGVGYSIRPEHE